MGQRFCPQCSCDAASVLSFATGDLGFTAAVQWALSYVDAHMWTLPAGKGFVERVCKMVGCGHMYGLLVRFI